MGIDAKMFVRTKSTITEEQLKKLRWQIGSSIGAHQFWIWEAEAGYSSDRHSLELVDVIHQDGPDIYPEEGETFLRVNIGTRYYGKNYERGDFPTIYMTAGWLEVNIPGAEVWYGGDSSGVLHKKFGPEERKELLEHYLKCGHEPYASYFSESLDTDHYFVPPCPNKGCDGRTLRQGFGQKYNSRYCPSCGRTILSRDEGQTWRSYRTTESLMDEKQENEISDFIMEFPSQEWLYRNTR